MHRGIRFPYNLEDDEWSNRIQWNTTQFTGTVLCQALYAQKLKGVNECNSAL